MDEANRVLRQRLAATPRPPRRDPVAELRAAQASREAKRQQRWSEIQTLIPQALAKQKQRNYPDMVGVSYCGKRSHTRCRQQTLAAWRLGSYTYQHDFKGESSNITQDVALLSTGELVLGKGNNFGKDWDRNIYRQGDLKRLVKELRRLAGLPSA
jgi:hypothetical protein